MNAIGFLLVTYNRPDMIRRLVDRLERSFPGAPIVCHHDFDQCDLDVDEFPKVTFVRPHIETSWAGFDTEEASFTALRTMSELADPPAWVVPVSAACYPIKPGHEIVRELMSSDYDAYLHHELIDPANIRRPWHNECVRRYFREPLPDEEGHPFTGGRRCYAGESWYTVNARAAKRLLEWHEQDTELKLWYRSCHGPGESYVHTILANEPDLKLCNDSRRFIVWEEGARHPSVLSMADLPALVRSTDHIARKFDTEVDPAVLDALDAIVDGKLPAGSRLGDAAQPESGR